MPPTNHIPFDPLPSASSNPSPFPLGPNQQDAPTPSTSQASSDRDPKAGDYVIDPSLLEEGVELRRRDQDEQAREETRQQGMDQAGGGKAQEQLLLDAEGNIVVGEASDASQGRNSPRPAEPALDQDLQEVQRLLDELHRNGTPAALERIKSAFAGMLDFSNEARKTFLHQSKSDREMSKENEKWKENPANKETLLGTKDFFNELIKEHTAPAREAAKDFDQSDPKWKHTIDHGWFDYIEQNPEDPIALFNVMMGTLDWCSIPLLYLYAPSLKPATLKEIVVRTEEACKKGLVLWLGCSTGQVIDMMPDMAAFIDQMTAQGAKVHTWSHLEHGDDKTDHPKNGMIADGADGRVWWYMFSGNLGVAGMGLEVYWREQIEEDEKEKKERQEKKKKREREEREEYGDFILGDDNEDVEYPSSFENMGQVYFDARSDTSGIWTLLSKHSRTYQIRRKMKVIVMHTPEFFKRHLNLFASNIELDEEHYSREYGKKLDEQMKERDLEARRAVGDIPIYYHHRDTLEVATFDAVQDQEENAAAIDEFYDPAFPTANLVAGVKQRDSAKRILNSYVERRAKIVKIDEDAKKARLAKQSALREQQQKEKGWVKKTPAKKGTGGYTSRRPRGTSSNRSSSRPRASSSNPTTSRSGSAHRQPGRHLQALNTGAYDKEILEILRGRDGLVAKWSDVASRLSLTGISGSQIKERYPHIRDAPPKPFSAYIDDFEMKVKLARGGTRASGNGATGEVEEGVAQPTGDVQDGAEHEEEEEDDDDDEGMEG